MMLHLGMFPLADTGSQTSIVRGSRPYFIHAAADIGGTTIIAFSREHGARSSPYPFPYPTQPRMMHSRAWSSRMAIMVSHHHSFVE